MRVSSWILPYDEPSNHRSEVLVGLAPEMNCGQSQLGDAQVPRSSSPEIWSIFKATPHRCLEIHELHGVDVVLGGVLVGRFNECPGHLGVHPGQSFRQSLTKQWSDTTCMVNSPGLTSSHRFLQATRSAAGLCI